MEIEEQAVRGDVYKLGFFHPVHIGETYNTHYTILSKLGYGMYSTVWLVRDTLTNRYHAMKILSNECYGRGHDTFEREILKHLANFNTKHPGYKHISKLVDEFVVEGVNGRHVCLVFDVMAETLETFCEVFGAEEAVPGGIVKRFARQLLQVLEYAHAAGVIHTDIKPDNIMIQLPDDTIIEEFYLPSIKEMQAEESHQKNTELSFLNRPNNSSNSPHPQKYVPTKSYPLAPYYLSSDTTTTDLQNLNITLCDRGVSSWTTNHLCTFITTPSFRAPEVIIGAPWGPAVDIWSLGAMIVLFMENVQLFNGDGIKHLKEIEELFGKFPDRLLKESGGEFVRMAFDERGYVKGMDDEGLVLEDIITGLEGEEKRLFLQVLRNMMRIDPVERKTAKESLEEPWLQDLPV